MQQICSIIGLRRAADTVAPPAVIQQPAVRQQPSHKPSRSHPPPPPPTAFTTRLTILEGWIEAGAQCSFRNTDGRVHRGVVRCIEPIAAPPGGGDDIVPLPNGFGSGDTHAVRLKFARPTERWMLREEFRVPVRALERPPPPSARLYSGRGAPGTLQVGERVVGADPRAAGLWRPAEVTEILAGGRVSVVFTASGRDNGRPNSFLVAHVCINP